VFSIPGAVGLPAAAMVSAWVFSRDPRFGPGWPAGSFVVGVLSLASGPLIQAGIAQDANGLLQRLGMWPALLWMSLVSARLLRLATGASSTAASGHPGRGWRSLAPRPRAPAGRAPRAHP
jgi:hypothetical protein